MLEEIKLQNNYYNLLLQNQEPDGFSFGADVVYIVLADRRSHAEPYSTDVGVVVDIGWRKLFSGENVLDHWWDSDPGPCRGVVRVVQGYPLHQRGLQPVALVHKAAHSHNR